MLKLFSRLANLVFIANYGLCSIAFVYFINRYDTGQWDSDGWDFFLIGGLISGTLALLFGMRLYRKVDLRSQTLILFLARQIVYGILFMTLAVALGSSIGLVISSLSQSDFGSLALILVIPFFITINLPHIVPLGVVVGLINGILFQGIHMLQTRKRLIENSQ
jgi:hypothetical protein